MAEGRRNSVEWIVISRVVGIVLFLAIVGLLAVLARYVDAPLFTAVVRFLVENTGLLVFIAILFLIADAFSAFAFPLNLPAPFFSATASIFLVAFLFRIFWFVDDLYNLGIFQVLEFIEPLVYPILFIAVLIFGYMEIFSRLYRDERPDEGRRKPVEKTSAEGKTWEEIGREFREAIYDAIHRIREEIRRK